MKIAIFTDSYYPMLNGVTISIANLAIELRALGHTVLIFAPKFDNYVENDKDVYHLKAFKVLSSEPEVHMPLLFPAKILKEIQNQDFDIIHAHGNGFFSFLGYQVAKIKGVPFVLSFHTQITQYMHYVFNGKVITPRMAATGLKVWGNFCDSVVTPSEKMKKELLSFGVKKPISVVPNFVYANNFQTTRKGYLHSLLKIPDDSPILLSVGRLGKEKNFPFLLRAFQKIALKDKTSHFVIIGDGEEAESIKKLAGSLSLNTRIHFTGKVLPQDIPLAYADSDVFLFSSTTEVHPMVVLEAAAGGLPFVVVKDDAYHNIVVDGENGFLVPLKINKFAEKVLFLLENEKTRKEFGAVSKSKISQHFDPKKLTKEMVSVYESTIMHHKTRRLNLKRINKAALTRLYRTTGFFSRIFQ